MNVIKRVILESFAVKLGAQILFHAVLSFTLRSMFAEANVASLRFIQVHV